jgi:hypothetical protein
VIHLESAHFSLRKLSRLPIRHYRLDQNPVTGFAVAGPGVPMRPQRTNFTGVTMQPAFPTSEAILAIEARQNEVLQKLDELEKRIAETLAACGDQRYAKALNMSQTIPMPDRANAAPLKRAA